MRNKIKYAPHLMVGDYHPVANPYICYMSDESTMQNAGGDTGGNQGDQSGGQGGDNSQQAGESNTGDNNDGHEINFDELFIEQPSNNASQNSGNASPSSESNSAANQGNNNNNKSGTPNAGDMTQIIGDFAKGLNFGEGLTEESYKTLVEGDLKGFNDMLQEQGRSVVTQILPVFAQALQAMESRVSEGQTANIQKMINDTLNTRKTETDIAGEFGFENNPTMQTIAENVYKGVLAKVGNDHAKALKTTREMLGQMNEHLNRVTNVGNPPDGSQLNMGQKKTDFAALFSDLPTK